MFGIQVDQDVLFPPADDKDYTMGLQFTTGANAVSGWVLDAIDFWGPAGWRRDAKRQVLSTFSGGVSAFTPLKGENGRILAASEPFPDDRPYASLAYLRASSTVWRGSGAWTTAFTLGMLGLPIAREFQTWVHANISDDVPPGGWDNQISNGGGWRAITAGYRVGYARLLAGQSDVGGVVSGTPGDIVATLDGSLGYYTMARAGLRARFGFVSSPWATAHSFLSGPPAELVDSRDGALLPDEFYLWAEVGQQVWGYNSLLQGQGDPDDAVNLSYDPSDPATLRRSVRDFSIGVTARWRRLRVTWSAMVWHSPLFEGPKSRNHEWGSLTIMFTQIG
jgi:hypothetical protein